MLKIESTKVRWPAKRSPLTTFGLPVLDLHLLDRERHLTEASCTTVLARMHWQLWLNLNLILLFSSESTAKRLGQEVAGLSGLASLGQGTLLDWGASAFGPKSGECRLSCGSTHMLEPDRRGRLVHEGLCGSHFGGWALVSKIARVGYYCPTLKGDCMDYMRRCDKYQRFVEVGNAPQSSCMPSLPCGRSTNEEWIS
ncbi:hypothetical protein CR513_33207, partial [Mucuna pruriens]